MFYRNLSHKKNLIFFDYYSNCEDVTELSIENTNIHNESHTIQNKLQKEMGDTELKRYEYLMQQMKNLHMYNGKSYVRPIINFTYNTEEKKMYFKILDDNFSECILCSNILSNIIDDNFDAEKKRRRIYELNIKYVQQFKYVFQPPDLNDKNNIFYPCHSVYSSIFENMKTIKKLYNKKDREKGRGQIYIMLDKEVKEKMGGEYNYVSNILNFKKDINRCIQNMNKMNKTSKTNKKRKNKQKNKKNETKE